MRIEYGAWVRGALQASSVAAGLFAGWVIFGRVPGPPMTDLLGRTLMRDWLEWLAAYVRVHLNGQIWGFDNHNKPSIGHLFKIGWTYAFISKAKREVLYSHFCIRCSCTTSLKP